MLTCATASKLLCLIQEMFCVKKITLKKKNTLELHPNQQLDGA